MKHTISAADREFRHAVEGLSFPVSDFNHRSHLRLAYIYLSEHESAEEAVAAMRGTLLELLTHAGVEPAEKYHATITEAWILALKHFMKCSTVSGSADQFIDQNAVMLDSSIMLTYYTKEVLFSDEARRTFIPPNLEPIPVYDS